MLLYQAMHGAWPGGSEVIPDGCSRLRLDAMVRGCRAPNVGFHRVRAEIRPKVSVIVAFAVDSRVARGQSGLRKYPRHSVDRDT